MTLAPDVLEDRAGLAGRPAFRVGPATDNQVDAYRQLRRQAFVVEQGLFVESDTDALDEAATTIVLVATDADDAVIGGVRIAPLDPGGAWWQGSRLVVDPAPGRTAIGAALVRAACATVEGRGALRFDAAVQPERRRFFERLGWRATGNVEAAGQPHVAMRWPIGRVEALLSATKRPLGALLAPLRTEGGLGGTGWVGDDAAPVPGSTMVAACDAILPSMVERDPEWAGWCAVLVNINDLAATGAEPVGLLDALGAPSAAVAERVVTGMAAAAAAYGVPVLGGHTQLGVPPSLSVTALGRAPAPAPGGGGRPGDDVVLSADLCGRWRPGYAGRQWDSTTSRSPAELRAEVGLVARARPVAAKDVSMAGIVGTLAMLAEASGCGAELVVADVPRPAGTGLGDWLTCFPGFAMLSADRPGRRAVTDDDRAPLTHGVCGRLVERPGVTLVWPDGERTVAVTGGATGLGPA